MDRWACTRASREAPRWDRSWQAPPPAALARGALAADDASGVRQGLATSTKAHGLHLNARLVVVQGELSRRRQLATRRSSRLARALCLGQLTACLLAPPWHLQSQPWRCLACRRCSSNRLHESCRRHHRQPLSTSSLGKCTGQQHGQSQRDPPAVEPRRRGHQGAAALLWPVMRAHLVSRMGCCFDLPRHHRRARDHTLLLQLPLTASRTRHARAVVCRQAGGGAGTAHHPQMLPRAGQNRLAAPPPSTQHGVGGDAALQLHTVCRQWYRCRQGCSRLCIYRKWLTKVCSFMLEW